MKKLLATLLAGYCAASAPGANIDLKESKFTQVVNDVQVISPSDNSRQAAKVDGIFKLPEVLRTGAASRAELVAADNTITRVGANTIFSFDEATRSIDLKQGSLLFNSPKGRGGGTIHSAAATAAVLGTTIIVVTTPNGGFKVLTLEGTCDVKYLKGAHRRLQGGQMTFVLPGSIPGPVLAFRLDKQVAGSRLVQGFTKPLPSQRLVNTQIKNQLAKIKSGEAQNTGLLIGDVATATTVEAFTQPIISLPQVIGGGTNITIGGVTVPIGGSGGTNINTGPPGGGSGGNTNVAPGVPTAPPGTIVAQNGGFLTPDGFIFTSFSTNGGPGPAFAQGVANATLTDATISSPTLDPSRVFIGGVQVTIPAQSFNGFAHAAFAARNLTISTPSIDFSSIASVSPQNFVIFASENMNIVNSLNLGTFSTDLILFAGNSFAVSSGVTISSDSTTLELGGRVSLNLDSVTFNNTGGDVFVESFNSITLNNSTVNALNISGTGDVSIGNAGENTATGNVTLNNTLVNGSEVDIFSGGTLTLSGTTPAAGQINGPSGIFLAGASGVTVGVNLSSSQSLGSIAINNSTSGTLTVNNGAKLTADTITLTSASGLFIDSIAAPTANNITATAGTSSTATIQNTDLSGVSSLNVVARTIVLSDVALPNSGDSDFTVANGVLAPNPNTSQAVVDGDLNFIKGVTYLGVLDNNGAGFTVHK